MGNAKNTSPKSTWDALGLSSCVLLREEKKMEKKCTPDRQAPAWANLNGKKKRKDEEEEVA